MARAARGPPAKDIAGTEGSGLAGRRVVLCVSGSVAAYRAIDVARLLMRHGADVTCVLSASAARLIRPEYFRWATGNAPVTRLTGRMEHVELADFGRADLVVAYPATANTVGMMAAGIDGTPVATVLTVALGTRVPVIACMAMHAAMHANPAVRRNVAFLRRRVSFVGPELAGGKARVAAPEEVLRAALAAVGASAALRGRRVLIVAGPTAERIDAVRSIVSHSSGETGSAVAEELARAGARVRMVYGPGCHEPPEGIAVRRVRSAAEMGAATRAELRAGAEIVVMAAAVADYAPASPRRSKVRSGRAGLTLRLRPTPKVVASVRRICPRATLVAFKAEAGVKPARLRAAGLAMMESCGADIVVANDVGGGAARRPTVVLARGARAGAVRMRGPREVARAVRAAVESALDGQGLRR
ncbi:MAG: bifunctional phosphopantothenoylcysteine decarboxylase/phosphopantothenate--cysteine ligase CoaBC [Thaumarchaeota archaeon]|nr:bifunctional phosphopantothenoylcysteine decarboxylase/phosphopantothenate--cysteine ligase CoaBC [Nitrososphaerota archaeon]